MNVEQIARIAFGLSEKGTLMPLKAVFDGSGKEESHPVITVGGFMADEELCRTIEEEWLRATGGKVFHFTDFGTKACKLGSQGWTADERHSFLIRLARIIRREGVDIICHAVEVSEYRKFLEKATYPEIYGPAYSTLAMLCVYNAETILRNQAKPLEKVAFIFEKGEREHELAFTLTELDKRLPQRDLRSHHFLPKDTAILQPADMVAGVVQRMILRAYAGLKCLDNGMGFTPLQNFARHFDTLTTATLPGNATVFRSVVNIAALRELNAITRFAISKNPGVIQRRMKAKVNQGRKSKEHANFDAAMKAILNADPTAVKEAMEWEKRANAVEREAKGERKRGRKPKSLSASARVSDATDD